MLVLNAKLDCINQLAFSPDGLSLAASGPLSLQVWPRWLNAPPQPVIKSLNCLDDFAFAPDGKKVFLYLSGNSRTRILDVAKGTHGPLAIPASGPSWFHFTEAGGFFIVSHGRGKLSRYDYTPGTRKRAALRWTIDRKAQGSHYAFGGVCGPAGVFVSLEYWFKPMQPTDGIVMRSVEDGSELRRERVAKSIADDLPIQAGRLMSIHPSGSYFAYGQGTRIRLLPLADKLKLPTEVVNTKRSGFRAVAFHPSGTMLAAARPRRHGENIRDDNVASDPNIRLEDWEDAVRLL